MYKTRMPASLTPLSNGVGAGGGTLPPDKSVNGALVKQQDTKHPPHTETAKWVRWAPRRASIALAPY
jgi:hypothetical protein